MKILVGYLMGLFLGSLILFYLSRAGIIWNNNSEKSFSEPKFSSWMDKVQLIDVKVGDIFLFDTDFDDKYTEDTLNPFFESKHLDLDTVKVIGIYKGYIKWQYLSTGYSQSSKIRFFKCWINPEKLNINFDSLYLAKH